MNYQGVIIEESLSDRSVLNLLDIKGTKVEEVTDQHKTPWLKQWTLHTVEVPEESAEKVARVISNSFDCEHSAWYADFNNDQYHYIIYPNKIFKIGRKNFQDYVLATEYGISLGIPAYQVDFSPNDEKWKR